jgi:hypothetical protein
MSSTRFHPSCCNICWLCKDVPLCTIMACGISRSIAPLILHRGIRWRWMVSLKPQPFYFRGKSLKYPLNKRLSGHQSWSGHFAQKICCPDRNQIPGHPACSIVTTCSALRYFSSMCTNRALWQYWYRVLASQEGLLLELSSMLLISA